MASELLPADLLQEVAPADVVAHAESTGWTRVSIARTDLAVFNDPDGSLRQVLVPLQFASSGYAQRIADAINGFADRDQRPPHEILNDLLARSADVLRFRIAIPGHDVGSVPLSEGIRLYEGVKQAILSAAWGVVSPQKVYGRLATASMEEFLNRCRLGQTERGSYIATVSCPMSALPERQREEVPFSRQTTGLLLNTMATLATAIENRREEEVVSLQDRNVVVSANLCEAIIAMQPEDEAGILTVRCSWAPSLPEPPQAPDQVTFGPRTREALTKVAATLKRQAPDPFTEYVASIEGLKSEPDLSKRELGVIVVKISDRGEPKKVRMEVTPEDYALACTAHRDGRGVRFEARLVRSVRSAHIDQYRNFEILPGLPNIGAIA